MTSAFDGHPGSRGIDDHPCAPGAASHWPLRLNRVHGDGYIIRALVDAEPVVRVEAELGLTADEQSLTAQIRQGLSVNDPVAIVVGPTAWEARPVVLRAARSEYAAVRALEGLGRRPTMLSANALLVCPESREVVVQRRSAVSKDFAGLLHTFGGVFLPESPAGRGHDHGSLIRTALRETEEEIGIHLADAGTSRMLVGEEPGAGFVNFALLGVPVSLRRLATARGSHEGSIVRIGFDDLHRRMAASDWAPAGRAQVLAWLALGAPVRGEEGESGRSFGPELFDRLVP